MSLSITLDTLGLHKSVLTMGGIILRKPLFLPAAEDRASASARTHSSALTLAISVSRASCCFLCCKRSSSCCKACCFHRIEASAAKEAPFTAAATLAQDTGLPLKDREQALDLVLDFETVRDPLLLTESSG